MQQPLTKIQLELVVLVANGYTNKDIAALTHRSLSSVDKILGVARKRAGAKTLAHLVSIVIASGLLVWTEDDRTREILLEEPSHND